MKLFLFLFLSIIPLSFQSMEAAIFCDDILREIYLVEDDKETEIANGWSGSWTVAYHFDNLNVEPGDLIRFKCYNSGSLWTFGAACFLVNDECVCYMFNDVNGIGYDYNNGFDRTGIFAKKSCPYKVYASTEVNNVKDYFYQNYVPLDASQISCKDYDKVFYVLYGDNLYLKLSDYISTNFKLKNIDVSIEESSEYFTLNNNKIDKNTKFTVSNNLIFNSKDEKKVKILFRNHGRIVDTHRDCQFYIRVCHKRCEECYDLNINETHHQCRICKKGFFLVEDTNGCMTKEEMADKPYYFDEETQKFKRCYESCATCYAKSFDYYHNCTKCKDSYHYVYNDTRKLNCIHESEKPSNTYLDSDTNTYELCYERCSRCSKKSDIKNNNCDECAKDENNNYLYHFIYNENGKCIRESEKPSDTYLNLEINTYELCYERCSSCDKKGDDYNNNCNECAKDDNNNYIYHFLHDKKGKCINENEKPENTYLDLETNTYELCYKKCSSCDKKGDINNNNCRTCLKDKSGNYIYHFIYDKKGKCVNELEKPLNSYLDLETNTYELCYERCSLCDRKGDKNNNNCNECVKDSNNSYLYHFVYNETGKCINESEKPSNTYLNLETNTYELCYERCSSCDKKGDNGNNNCNACLKDKNNNYLYHFIYNETGKCINESQKPLNTYLDIETNTYRLCYERCSSCNKSGDHDNNNCNNCLMDKNNNYLYHFIYNEKGKCISESEKPSNTYLNLETNTYELCYERCSSCDKKGDNVNNNCNDCLKDKNNNYLYHFIENELGKCLNDYERPSNTYLDKENNTYKLCYTRCSRCEGYPLCKECKKDESNNYIFHFIYDEEGKCIDESEIKDGYYYLDTNDNTYKSCPKGTIRVEKNECIENNIETIILAFIIIIIILIFVPLFFIWKMFYQKQRRNKEMMKLVIDEK